MRAIGHADEAAGLENLGFAIDDEFELPRQDIEAFVPAGVAVEWRAAAGPGDEFGHRKGPAIGGTRTEHADDVAEQV